MSIGIIGAQRVGKTTICKKIADDYGVTFLQTNVTSVFEELGLSPKLDYDFATRLMIQECILNHLENVYTLSSGEFITDRTPLDALSYLMADVRRENVTGDTINAMMKYADRCFLVTKKHFAFLTLIQPGIPIEETPGKAPSNIAYMEHLNAICRGLVGDGRLGNDTRGITISRSVVSLERRVELIVANYRKTAEFYAEYRARNYLPLH